MKIILLCIICILCSTTVTSKLLGSRIKAPSAWIKAREGTNGNAGVRFSVALYQRNLDVLEELFWNVSNPDHVDYGKYKSIDYINELIAPHQDDVEYVVNYFKKLGAHKIEIYGDAIQVVMSVKDINKIFNTKLYTFTNVESNKKVIKVDGNFYLPIDLYNQVEMITGLSEFPVKSFGVTDNKRNIDDSDLANIEFDVVPQTIWSLYNVQENYTVSNHQRSQSVIEFQAAGGIYWNDLLTFWKITNTTNNKNISQDHVVGPFYQSSDEEAALDIQYVTGVALNAENWYWTEVNWLYDFAMKFSQRQYVPEVMSISYGWAEAHQCQLGNYCDQLGINSQQYVARTNTEFKKIGLRGVSILTASGDSGANGRSDGMCSESFLNPVFPASSPYVTSVGANELQNAKFNLQNPPPVCSMHFPGVFGQGRKVACASDGLEVAVSYNVSGFASGGGFSNLSPTPSYQMKAVRGYLNSGVSMPTNTFNRSGRAFPDISALGHAYVVQDNGVINSVGGTSASSPASAGLVTLLNTHQKSHGRALLGFLNPLLYKMWDEDKSCFNDITIGDNKCTEQGCDFPVFGGKCQGFECTAGYDPVTGLGSLSFGNVISYLDRM